MSSDQPGISFHELFAYSDYLAKRWFHYLGANPGALDVAIGGRTGKVSDLVLHLVLVEQTFANLLHDNTPPTPPSAAMAASQQQPRTVENFAKIHREAMQKLDNYVERAGDS